MSTENTSTGAAILYGRGGSLGNFKVFADSLKKRLTTTYGNRIVSKNVERRDAFFQFFQFPGVSYKLREVHIFSHSVGAGLFLAYGDSVMASRRNAAYDKASKKGRKVTYNEVLAAEAGTVFTDNLITKKRSGGSTHLTSDATVKVWGCNAGIANWVYSDDDPSVYYWQALNTMNTPKPSIAQALASFFGRSVSAATSGSHIEVKHKQKGDKNMKWVKTSTYKSRHGVWPSGALPHRLHPDVGVYREFKPVLPKKSP